jgi:hypothetical protein
LFCLERDFWKNKIPDAAAKRIITKRVSLIFLFNLNVLAVLLRAT